MRARSTPFWQPLVNASAGKSIAEVACTHPKITVPANVGKQLF
jgi:hypothetical protein